MPARASVRHAIDAAWLAELAAADPAEHAFAIWDLQNCPDRIEFRVLHLDERPVAYLLLWKGSRTAISVRWVGPTQEAMALLDELPPRPFVAIVPDAIGPLVADRRGPAGLYGISLRTCREPPPVSGSARRLLPSDLPELERFARENAEPLTSGYLGVPLDRELVVGSFEEGRLVCAGRAQTRLPSVWMLGGIFTRPEARGRGHGKAVTSLLAHEAARAGAISALYVRDGNTAALATYDRLGFRPVAHRIWVDAGADWPA
jgi:ribosomal protein S18 acetylase RimI-like enzyme